VGVMQSYWFCCPSGICRGGEKCGVVMELQVTRQLEFAYVTAFRVVG
jgi:hypothetical protein